MVWVCFGCPLGGVLCVCAGKGFERFGKCFDGGFGCVLGCFGSTCFRPARLKQHNFGPFIHQRLGLSGGNRVLAKTVLKHSADPNFFSGAVLALVACSFALRGQCSAMSRHGCLCFCWFRWSSQQHTCIRLSFSLVVVRRRSHLIIHVTKQRRRRLGCTSSCS